MDKMNDLRTGTEEKLIAVLTTKQQAKWKEIQGEPFKMEMASRRGGRGGNDGETARGGGGDKPATDKPAAEKPATTRPKAPASGREKLPPRPPK